MNSWANSWFFVVALAGSGFAVAEECLASDESCMATGAPKVKFTLQPGDSWEAVKNELLAIEAMLRSESETSDMVWNNDTVATHKSVDHARTPWTWHDLDDDFAASIAGMKPGRALDFGSGRGWQGLALAKLGWEVVGVDNGKESVKLSNDDAATQKLTNVKFIHGDLLKPTELLAMPEFGRSSFDLIIDRGCLHTLYGLNTNIIPDLYFFLIRYLLRPGGTFALKTLHFQNAKDLASTMGKLIRVLKYDKTNKTSARLKFLNQFWVTKTGHMNPMRPFMFNHSVMTSLVGRYIKNFEMWPSHMMTIVEHGTDLGMGLLAPLHSMSVKATPSDGPFDVSVSTGTDQLLKLHKYADLLSASDLQVMMDAATFGS